MFLTSNTHPGNLLWWHYLWRSTFYLFTIDSGLWQKWTMSIIYSCRIFYKKYIVYDIKRLYFRLVMSSLRTVLMVKWKIKIVSNFSMGFQSFCSQKKTKAMCFFSSLASLTLKLLETRVCPLGQNDKYCQSFRSIC